MIRLYTMDSSAFSYPDLCCLSPYRIGKARRYIREKDRRLSLSASLLIDRGLREYGLEEKSAVICCTPSGKPYLRDYDNIHFSVSHSGSRAAVAFSDGPVGCDIEYVHEYDEGVAALVFTSSEKLLLSFSADRNRDYTRLWTAKESFLKAIGCGFTMDPLSFSVTLSDGMEVNQDLDERRWKITFKEDDEYIIALCTEVEKKREEQRLH